MSGVFAGVQPRRVKPVLFVLLALPAAWLVWQWIAFASGTPHGLGFNPQEFSNRFSGRWALRCLLLALALTPLSDLSGRPWPVAFRRMVGLFAYAYAVLHLSSYVVLDLFFDWRALWEDIAERRYITFGVAAFLLLTPLALTSTGRAVKRLGARRWRRLHRLVYAAGVGAVLHFLMLAKGDRLEATIYAGICMLLLGYRAARAVCRRAVRRLAVRGG